MLKIKIHRSIPLVLALVTTTICECSEWSEAFSLSHPFIWVQLNNTVNTQNIQQQQHYLIFPFSFPSQKEQTEEKRWRDLKSHRVTLTFHVTFIYPITFLASSLSPTFSPSSPSSLFSSFLSSGSSQVNPSSFPFSLHLFVLFISSWIEKFNAAE